MPQQSLLPDYPPMTSMVLRIESYPHTLHSDTVRITVQIGEGGRDPGTVVVIPLLGVEADYVNTIVGEAATAYMYGETPKDVRQALRDVWALARQHGASHQF